MSPRSITGGAWSGLRAAVDILEDIDDIHIAELTSVDGTPPSGLEIVDAMRGTRSPGRAAESGGSAGVRAPAVAGDGWSVL